MINWKVRIRNKAFWMAIIPAILLLAQSVVALFGYELQLGDTEAKLLAVVNQIFMLLAILGIINDPTTAGLGDSKQALAYKEPKKEPDIAEDVYQ